MQERFIQHKEQWRDEENNPGQANFDTVTPIFGQVSAFAEVGEAGLRWIKQELLLPSDEEREKLIGDGLLEHFDGLAEQVKRMERWVEDCVGSDGRLECAARYRRETSGGAEALRALQLTSCKQRGPDASEQNFAPHFGCDLKDCCGLLAVQTFTLQKRLVGYGWYAMQEWWNPGLEWSGGGPKVMQALRWKKLGLPESEMEDSSDLVYWEKKLMELGATLDMDELATWHLALQSNYPWRDVAKTEAAELLYMKAMSSS